MAEAGMGDRLGGGGRVVAMVASTDTMGLFMILVGEGMGVDAIL